MKQINKSITLILIASIIISLCACSKREQEPTNNEPLTTSSETSEETTTHIITTSSPITTKSPVETTKEEITVSDKTDETSEYTSFIAEISKAEKEKNFRKLVDLLEQCVNELSVICNKYPNVNPDKTDELPEDYAEAIKKFEAVAEAIDKIDLDEMEMDDVMYYLKVMGRVSIKMKKMEKLLG